MVVAGGFGDGVLQLRDVGLQAADDVGGAAAVAAVALGALQGHDAEGVHQVLQAALHGDGGAVLPVDLLQQPHHDNVRGPVYPSPAAVVVGTGEALIPGVGLHGVGGGGGAG